MSEKHQLVMNSIIFFELFPVYRGKLTGNRRCNLDDSIEMEESRWNRFLGLLVRIIVELRWNVGECVVGNLNLQSRIKLDNRDYFLFLRGVMISIKLESSRNRQAFYLGRTGVSDGSVGPRTLQALQFTNVNEACSKADRHNCDAWSKMFVISTAPGRQTMARRCAHSRYIGRGGIRVGTSRRGLGRSALN